MFERLLAGIALSSAKWLIVRTHEVNFVKCIKRSLTKGHWWQMQLLHCGVRRGWQEWRKKNNWDCIRGSVPSPQWLRVSSSFFFFSVKELQGVSFRPLLTFLYIYVWIKFSQGFPGGLVGKESSCNTRDYLHVGTLGSVPGSGEGNGNVLQYSYLENPMDRGAWWAIVHGATKSQTQLK